MQLDHFLESKNNKNTLQQLPAVKNPTKIPWVDKYRPKNLDGIIHQEEIINLLKESLKTGNLPHLLLYGPPGTGKTSTILAFACQLFGPKYVNERVIELNASDERGINVVRVKITNFAKMAIGNSDPNFPSPNYKLVILDEADAMTNEAQAALRKVMEEMSTITRFIFICNYVNQIIEPITSRCTKFRFKPIDSVNVFNKLKSISDKENLNLSDDILNAINEVVKGDIRKGIMTLQNLKYVQGYKKINVEDVYDITGYVPMEKIKNMINICTHTNSTVKNILNEVNKIKRNGYPVISIMEQFKKYVISADNINDDQKSVICIQFGMTEKRITSGADEYIQLFNICVYILGVINNKIDYISTCLC